MRRAFLSLFLLLSISILVMGFLLDKAWDHYHPQGPDPLLKTLGLGMANQFLELSPVQRDSQIKAMVKNNSNLFGVEWLTVSDIATGDLKNRLVQEKLAYIQSQTPDASKAINYFYLLASDEKHILLIKQLQQSPNRLGYLFFVLVFYLVIALTLLLWLWPIARDLVQMGNYVNQFHGDKSTKPLTLNKHSLIFPVAQKLSDMEQRIADLVQSHIEMRSAVSHELRTPLARMKFALAMADNESCSASMVKMLEQLQSDIHSMETLINGLLAYAGFEIHNRELDQRQGYAVDLINEIIKRIADSSPIKIAVIDQLQGELLTCEWQLMGQAIENLLSNAVDFSQEHIRVILCATPTHWRIVVEDDGVGVSEMDRERIFELFYRSPEAKQQRSGFGLGLALVARILQWHGGKAIYGASTLGGAAFYLTWPKTQIR